MEKIRCLIVDDNRRNAETVKAYLSAYGSVEVIGICYSAIEAFDLLNGNVEVDLIITDIRMARISGMEMIRSFGNQYRYIIVTAYPDHALDGFEPGVVDFVLKPFTMGRLFQALNKYRLSKGYPGSKELRAELETPREGLEAKSHGESVRTDETSAPETITFKHHDILVNIPSRDIQYVEARKDYMHIVTERKTYHPRITLDKFHRILGKEIFVRIHRSYLVNREMVLEIRRYSMLLTSDITLPIGRTYWTEVKKEFFGR